jgi:hypothetical protein
MFITSIIFFIALLGIVLMIYLKARRLKLDVRSQFSFVSAKVDHKIRGTFGRVRQFLSYFNRKSAVALMQWIAYHVLSWARNAYLWFYEKAHAHPHSKKVIDMVRGRGDASNMGGASFYLKRIAPEEAPQAKPNRF